MADALASSVINALLALELGGTSTDASNRFSFDGVTLRSNAGESLGIGVQKFEALSLRLTSGPFVVEIGRLTLSELVAEVRINEGAPRLRFAKAADAELADVKVHGPLMFSRKSQEHLNASHVADVPPRTRDIAAGERGAEAWCLGPLAAADGTIRAKIVDAALVFDADVTVPIRGGEIDFNEATVEHIGPDSRMGVSRLGLYVDAPNGRSYIYQFSSTPAAGVAFEQRDGLLGAWVANRGNLKLQPFAEGLLRQAASGAQAGFTEDARLLLDRTAVSGDVQLSDGRFSAPGLEVDLVGRAEGRNAITLRSKAVGRGLTAEMSSVSVQHAVLKAGDMRLDCAELTGALVLRLLLEDTQLRFELDVPNIKISGVRVHPGGADRDVMEIKAIRTKLDYESALKEIETLMNAKRNSPEGDKLDVLVTLVEAYEARHFPLDLPDAVIDANSYKRF